MTHGRPPSDRGGVPWWVWLLIVLAIIAAVAALWYFYLRPSTPETTGGEVFVGNWAPEDGTGGGLVIKQDGDQFKVTQYDPTLQQAGIAPRPRSRATQLNAHRQGLRHRPHRRHRDACRARSPTTAPTTP